ncbi:PREDICTED: rho-N domain-containing protein 1, chloroplastic-like [Lupinus angustifolius]|uniref:rho-N domain-containing protein 1, chloroplastic-like n=1 Tax=Lupinus angustifolius TaxID=3871 RepID=UPI00092E4391|nr:PREDICTED: rho-N domain-containing protein 1, chloroplastic-like [Lupinus angustifolius]
MSQTAHVVVGCGMSEGRCLPCSGVSGRTAAVYSSSSLSHYRIHSLVKLRGLKYASVSASFVCEARRNPDFSRQNKHGSSRSRNKHNEGRDSFEHFEEDMLSLKNGPLPSLSASGKSQATAVPGLREKEIVELFRKVQARLRERAATKEQKRVEASPVRGKENGTVDSLLKLLKKHSSDQQNKSSGGGRGKDYSLDGSQETSQYNGRRSTKISNLDNAAKDESQESNISSISRPQSSFQRRSPVPRVKFQPIGYDEEDTNVIQPSREVRVNNHNQRHLKIDHKEGPGSEPDLDHDLKTDSELDLDHESDQDSEPVLVPKDELFFPGREIDDLSDDDSEHTDNDEHAEEEELVVQHEDLSALKLPELRAIAKSRGLKGFSKMKKGDLVELLSGN